MTVHGDAEAAEAARQRCAADAEVVRSRGRARPALLVGELLVEWFEADQGWRPSTLSGYRSIVRFLTGDPLGGRKAVTLDPGVMRAAVRGWLAAGHGEATVWGRVRCLRSALGWAYAERILDRHPLDGMRGPPPPGVRLHAPVETVRAILARAADEVSTARAVVDAHPTTWRRLDKAEQVLLLARLAADTGARRGELAALQVEDLDGDVLTIARGTSCEVVGPTKSGRIRRLTLGASTADLWRDLVGVWRERASAGPGQLVEPGRDRSAGFGPWLFSPDPEHTTRLLTGTTGRWFTDLTARAGHGDVTLHRLRHSVATALVGRGDLLAARYRLGHRDASTTLRIYSHALPLADADAAATMDALYR